MLSCKTLLYHSVYQEAITPIHANLLVKWAVADNPSQIAQQAVPFHWQKIPQAVLLPNQDWFAVARNGIHQSYIEIYRWDDLTCCDQIAVPHAAYTEIDDDDPFCGHERCCTLSHLSITPCGQYLVVIEDFGDVHLLALATRTWTRLKRRLWADYSEMIAFDPALQFLVTEIILTDAIYSVYRIDDLTTDQMTLLGEFEGIAGCHRGQLRFSPEGTALVRTGYRCDIEYYGCDAVAYSLSKRWTQRFPYIQHPHRAHHPWQSSVVFQDASTLLFAAGQAIAQINTAEGAVLAEYATVAVVNAIAYDPGCDRIIAATNNGVMTVAIRPVPPLRDKLYNP
jgi:hypothetical protein